MNFPSMLLHDYLDENSLCFLAESLTWFLYRGTTNKTRTHIRDTDSLSFAWSFFYVVIDSSGLQCGQPHCDWFDSDNAWCFLANLPRERIHESDTRRRSNESEPSPIEKSQFQLDVRALQLQLQFFYVNISWFVFAFPFIAWEFIN